MRCTNSQIELIFVLNSFEHLNNTFTNDAFFVIMQILISFSPQTYIVCIKCVSVTSFKSHKNEPFSHILERMTMWSTYNIETYKLMME